jgi:hypothetical protein
MKVVNSTNLIKSQESSLGTGGATTTLLNGSAPKIEVAMQRTSKMRGGVRLKGRTNGVVVGEVVDLLITDMFGKSIAARTKVAGDGRFRVYTDLSLLANNRLELTATTTSLDGAFLKTESFWALKLPTGVFNISLLDGRYECFNFVQIVKDSQRYVDKQIATHCTLATFEPCSDSSFLDTMETTDSGLNDVGLAPVSFQWADGTRHPRTEDGVYSISSHGFIIIAPVISP